MSALSVETTVVLKRPSNRPKETSRALGGDRLLRFGLCALVRFEADGSLTVLDLRAVNPDTAEEERLEGLDEKLARQAVENAVRGKAEE